MSHPYPDPRYVTLDSAGDGTVTFRGGAPTIWRQITKITIESQSTGSGTVSIYYRGTLMTSKAIALMMSAVGLICLGPSEQIDVNFTGGSPNAQVKVTAHTADVRQLAPEQAFAWGESVGFAAPIDNPVLMAGETDLLLEDFWFYQTDVLDVRAYNSYALNMEFNNGTWADDGVIDLFIDFYADAAATILLFSERYQFFHNSDIPLSDQMHGPFMQVSVEDSNSTGESTELTYRLFGSYRVMSHAYLRSSDDNRLYDTVSVNMAAGTDDGGGAAKLGFGPAMISFISSQVPAKVDIRIEGTSTNAIVYELYATTANVRTEKFIILPRTAAWVVMSNQSGAVATLRAQLNQQVQPL